MSGDVSLASWLSGCFLYYYYLWLLCCARLLEVHSALRLSALCSALVSDLIARLRVLVSDCAGLSVSHHVSVQGRLRARFIVPRHTLVHRLPSGKTVGRQGGATGFILHQKSTGDRWWPGCRIQ